MNTMLESKKYNLSRKIQPHSTNKLNQVLNTCSWAGSGVFRDIYNTISPTSKNNNNNTNGFLCNTILDNFGNMKVTPQAKSTQKYLRQNSTSPDNTPNLISANSPN